MSKKRNYTWHPEIVCAPKNLTVVEYFTFLSKILVFSSFTLAVLISLFFATTFNLINLKLFLFKIWAKFALYLCSLNVICKGTAVKKGLIASNHISWIDILAIMSIKPGKFIAKSEVGRWFIFGRLARIAGTIFIQRNSANILKQLEILQKYLQEDELIILFPEGTSSDGLRLLPFNSSLLQAVYPKVGKKYNNTQVQTLTLFYIPEKHLDRDFFAWFSSRTLLRHISTVLGVKHTSTIYMTFGVAEHAEKFKGRKDLSNFLFQQISHNFPK